MILSMRSRQCVVVVVLAAALAIALGVRGRSVAGEVSASQARLRADVAYLADDAREGRAPGSAGIEAAADYIAAAFKDAGLKPAEGAEGYFQKFSISGTPRLGEPQQLAFNGPDEKTIPAALKTDFSPLAIGSGGKLDAVPVAFAGYGITADDEELHLKYDDYAPIDAKGKAVLILRREPQEDKDDSPFSGKKTTSYAFFAHKISNAFQHGAAAVLLVNDDSAVKGDKADELLGFDAAGPSKISNLPVVMITRVLADKLLEAAGQPKLATLEADIDEGLKPQSRLLEGWSLNGSVTIDRTPIETKNVVGVLEGAGPLADETVVIGAHYDHLGRGGSGSLAFFSNAIHNGADDNASGTAMVMEMARRLARRVDPLPRRVVFIAFSGEERGLLGSAHYVSHPLYPLDQTAIMVNFDMVGRLNDKNELTVYGTGTSPGLDALVEALGKAEGFVIKKIADGFGPSDQASFYRKDIPVLFPFTGTHKDYHRPSDDTETLNFAGMARIADLSEILLLDLIRRPERPSFTRVRAATNETGRVSLNVYLGTIPDYDDEQKGVKLSGVRDGSPAEKGGLKGGDVIVGLGGKPIGTINDYMESLGRYKPGDTAEIVVKRDGKETTLTVTFGSRSSE
jgi:Peptidase family M28/PDZ domain/PA domain